MLFNQDVQIPESLQTKVLQVSLIPERLRYNIRIKKTDLSAAKKASGLKFPTKIGSSFLSERQSILCLGPDEWIIIADPKESKKLLKALKIIEVKFTVSVTNISHRNVGFSLSGTETLRVLNAGCPLDLSIETFPVGKTTRTVFESAAIILTRVSEGRFEIECWRSFAPYLRDFFTRIANDIPA